MTDPEDPVRKNTELPDWRKVEVEMMLYQKVQTGDISMNETAIVALGPSRRYEVVKVLQPKRMPRPQPKRMPRASRQ